MTSKNLMRLFTTLYILFLIVLILTTIEGVNASLGSYKQGECVQIKTILNTTSVNISTINYPNSTIAITNQAMTRNGYSFNYSFCNTSTLGTYVYDYVDTITGNVYVNDFIITTTGYELNTSKSIVILIGLGIMLLIGVLLFIFGIYTKGIVKVFTIGLSILMIAFSLGYSINVMSAGVGEFSSLINGFNGLWFLVTVLLICAGAGLVLYLIVVSLKAFNKTRGFED